VFLKKCDFQYDSKEVRRDASRVRRLPKDFERFKRSARFG